jgi:CubicO group peptidase (beta-lactamase class C family)
MNNVITKEHILKLVSKQKELNFNPGEEYAYCNTGFTLLAEVVSRTSDMSFAEFTEVNIFEPLKMNNTLFYDDHEKIVKNRAYSYNSSSDGYKKSVLNYANVGATSLFTTVEDLALWSMNFSNLTVGDSTIVNKMNTTAILNNGKTM